MALVRGAEVGREDVLFEAPGAEEEIVLVAGDRRTFGTDQLQIYSKAVGFGGKEFQRHGSRHVGVGGGHVHGGLAGEGSAAGGESPFQTMPWEGLWQVVGHPEDRGATVWADLAQ